MKKILRLVCAWAVLLSLLSLLAAPFFYSLATSLFPFSVAFSYALQQGSGIAAFQYSHSGWKPQDYVAIFGDSYAFGQGDGLNTLQTTWRPAYNVTHFIYQSKQAGGGLDMVSFGMPSSGSVKAYITDPAAQMHYMSQSSFRKIGKPAYIVLYFYEGNDIEENVFSKLTSPLADNDVCAQAVLPVDLCRMVDFIHHAVLFVSGRSRWPSIFRALSREPAPAGHINRIFLDGHEVATHDGFQGPSMLLTDAETEQGFAVLSDTLRTVRKTYPDTPIAMLDIPSPATVYRFISADIDLWDLVGNAESRLRPSASIRPRSNDFCLRAMQAANQQGIYFHDARPALVAKGEHVMLHGPVDTHHFNLEGYHVLSDEVLKVIRAMQNGSDAGLLPCAVLQ